MKRKNRTLPRITRILLSAMLVMACQQVCLPTAYAAPGEQKEAPALRMKSKMSEQCTVTIDGNTIKVTDEDSNNDVWNSKTLVDTGMKLQNGKQYKISYTLTGDNGVGEFFLCKRDNIDVRYDETWTCEDGVRSIAFTANGDKLYIGMQVGNCGVGNSVTAEITELCELEESEAPQLLRTENCLVELEEGILTATDIHDNNDVWNSKILYDPGYQVEIGKQYKLDLSLAGANGVGEFFICRSQDLNDRYDTTFLNVNGDHSVAFVADTDKVYIGLQMGNVGKDNKVEMKLKGFGEFNGVLGAPAAGGSGGGSTCKYTVDRENGIVTIKATDKSGNNDVWNSRLIVDSGLELEPGKTYEIMFDLEGEYGVGEFFLCKSKNIDDRYDSTFFNANGRKTVILTAESKKLYIGMQMGNIGRNHTVTSRLLMVEEYDPETGGMEGVKTNENCEIRFDENGNLLEVTVTDTDKNNDVWNSKFLYYLGTILEPGEEHIAKFRMTGANGVGEVFFLKDMDMDHRYTFDNTAGDHTARFTAEDAKLYLGMQFGDIGKGNEMTMTIFDIFRVPFIQKYLENVEEDMNRGSVSLKDLDDNNDVWNSKGVYDSGMTLVPGKTYNVTFTLSGDNGVGEFFFLKDDNIDNRYTFTDTPGTHTVTFVAEGEKLYFGIQCGNLGKGSSVTVSNIELTEAPAPEKKGIQVEEVLAENAFGTLGLMDGNTVIRATDTDDNGDVWNSKLMYKVDVILSPGKRHIARFKLDGAAGVGEFFFLKEANMDSRYTFDNTAGEHEVEFVAEGTDLYAGMQFGNIGKDNSLELTLLEIVEAEEEIMEMTALAETEAETEATETEAPETEAAEEAAPETEAASESGEVPAEEVAPETVEAPVEAAAEAIEE